MKVLIACDGFKESLSSKEVGLALAAGLREADEEIVVDVLSMADGGEGTSFILTELFGARLKTVEVKDPLGRPVWASYGLHSVKGEAYIELAQASGLERLAMEERNPLQTTTFGTGQLIIDALESGATRIILGIGGSATNDAGMGMAEALGFLFFDEGHNVLTGKGANLEKVVQISDKDVKIDWEKVHFEVFCDVKNPLFGSNGAAFVYAPQKGAAAEEVAILDTGLRVFADVIQRDLGVDIAHQRGAGAAGGVGAGAMAFFGAELRPGAELMLDLVDFDKRIGEVDLIITGEGRIDKQTFSGKLVYEICRRAGVVGKPVIGVCGDLSLSYEEVMELGMQAAFSISMGPASLINAMEHTKGNLKRLGFAMAKLIRIGRSKKLDK